MNWVINFFTSSIGKKVIMSLTGLFLISFLVVHLAGNLQLLVNDGGQQFNLYAQFMTENPIIQFTAYGLYVGFLLHIIQGIILWIQNKKARGSNGYAVKVTRATATNAFAAKNMAWLGILILIFLVIHMGDFWYATKFGSVAEIAYDGIDRPMKNLYMRVDASFHNPIIVVVYVLGMIALGLHLLHGFQSAFQTLGLNHPKYSPFIKGIGFAFSIIVPLMYAAIPILVFFGYHL